MSAPVVFLVLTYQKPALAERLMGRLADTENALTVLSHDPLGDRPPELPDSPRAMRVPNPLPVGKWGSFEIVEAMIEAVRWVQEEVRDFSWLVLLSGQDYPIKSPRAIEAELLASDADAYMRWELATPFARRHQSDWQRGMSHRYYWRVAPGTTRPVPIPRVRAYFDGVGIFAGSTWSTFSRRAVARMFEDPWLLDYLKRRFSRTMIPDEAFFQTLLLNRPTRLHIVNNDRRFMEFAPEHGYAHPRILGLDDFTMLIESDVMFARKVDETSAPLLDRLDEVQSGVRPAGA
jgi:hypothetical protein